MSVDRDSADPPYLQVASILRARISSGEFPAGSRLPSISYLMHEYGIARNTARRAMAELVQAGQAEVRQGWGTFVSRPL